MTDMPPFHDNRVANVINLIFHPAVICVPTLLIILSGEDPSQIVRWTVISLAILLIPAFTVIGVLRTQGRFTYQRQSRLPIYVSGIVSVIVNLIIMSIGDAPRILIACFATLLVWLPLQMGINQWVTKISAHTAVVSGCLFGLLMAGKMPIPPGIGIILLCLMGVGVARIVTRNHTLQQVVLGAVVGMVPVLVVFPLVLR